MQERAELNTVAAKLSAAEKLLRVVVAAAKVAEVVAELLLAVTAAVGASPRPMHQPLDRWWHAGGAAAGRGRGRLAEANSAAARSVVASLESEDDTDVMVMEAAAGGRGRGLGRGGRGSRGGGRQPGLESGSAGVETCQRMHPSTPRIPPPLLLQHVYIGKFVAFSPAREPWMNKKSYRPAGTAYIVGRVCRPAKKVKGKFQIRWIDTEFQSSIENISVGTVQLGIDNYRELTKSDASHDWQGLLECDESEQIQIDDEHELEEA
ncbi:unnamed protein product [Phytophthora fragariaefolia]|uniref:Unnamed protein product n=1 Tax=Phytophthora fragariaefolia TaxID=1490495 RepID=A0A9W7CSW7_9STRA|nr:unnamed protein product [Phytophthora fragariaefolia]